MVDEHQRLLFFFRELAAAPTAITSVEPYKGLVDVVWQRRHGSDEPTKRVVHSSARTGFSVEPEVDLMRD